GRSLREL
ncbi:hypothetical protein D039_0668B, partial [Vibrio parahaemolyticus EKP-028]